MDRQKYRKNIVRARRVVKVALVAAAVVAVKNHLTPTPEVTEGRAFIYPDGGIIIKM